MLQVFISGLEKQSGKTLVAAGLAATMQSLSYSTGVYKPIITGAELTANDNKNFSDLALLNMCDPNISVKCLYSLSKPDSPFVGAYEDNIKIDINEIYSNYNIFASNLDCSLVEGINSISTPVTQNVSEIDIVRMLNIPLILVVNPNSSSIDDVLMALSYIKSNGVHLQGVVINQYDDNSNILEIKYFPQIIKELSGINILGCMPDYGNISSLDPGVLIADVLNRLRLEEIFGLKIAKLD